jgi:hypothetical protein
MAARRVTWNGTPDEAIALLHALRSHCECRVDQGRTVEPCASHKMLARDQRAVDGLLFMRRIAARLLAEEFDVPWPASPASELGPAGERQVRVGRRQGRVPLG